MAPHSTIKGVYGPGTFADTSYTPLPDECRRLLQNFAQATPGFNDDGAILRSVNFHGGRLPIIPGPLKSQALSAVCQAMIGIVGKEICARKGTDTGKISINVDKSGLYPATPALVSIDNKDFSEMKKHGTVFKAGTDLDKGVLTKNNMHFRSWSIYPTKDP
ncbi:hypothetical protein QQS21_000013 [Conoideocrella luteorostrata]|uniref:Uncharacterized protein n=1 Tax=Conoideocrella luteorostrata TaxID=1105319 RepID=A0AAJ0FZI0_9HYPO|nr:hypothetical protein QQS21_000013 [Conoideocrella luteorostrata]